MDTVIWALDNAGGNKKAVVTHLLRLGFVFMTDHEARKLGRGLSRMRDEAAQEHDMEKMEFFHSIRNCTFLRGVRNFYI